MSSRPSQFTFTSEGPLRLYNTTELLNLPAPTWLIDDVLPMGGLVGLYGPPASFKSFAAIDLALCVATGTPWQGHDVDRGFVVYISAEGGTGIGKRAAAWLVKHGINPEDTDIAWLVESIPVTADSEQMAKLIDRIVQEIERKPVLVIIDTLARCFDGDENQQEDMGRFIAGVDMLRSELGCTVVVVHHTRLAGDRERGNTAFRGAADTMISVSRKGGNVELACNKQKDSEEFTAIGLTLEVVEGTDSCVMVTDGNREEILKDMVETLRILQPCKWQIWMDATGLGDDIYKYHPTLKKLGLVEKDADGLWRVVE